MNNLTREFRHSREEISGLKSEIRGPKSEIRNPKGESRVKADSRCDAPKAESRKPRELGGPSSPAGCSGVSNHFAEPARGSNTALATSDFGLRISDFFRISALGFRISSSDFFRVSAFGFRIFLCC